MGKKDTLLTTKEFASRSGLTASQITKMLREKKLKGRKQSGKWMIPESQLPGEAVSPPPSTPQKTTPTKSTPKPRASSVYSVPEFSAMTYLTESGVVQWLKLGRLQGAQAPGGEWQVDAASLVLPGIQHLLRS